MSISDSYDHEEGLSRMSTEQKQAVIDLFDELEEREEKNERRKKVDRVTRKISQLWSLIEDEIVSIRETYGLPELERRVTLDT